METGFFLTDNERRGFISKPDSMYMADYLWERYMHVLSYLDADTFDYIVENIGRLSYSEIRRISDRIATPEFAFKILGKYFITDTHKADGNVSLNITENLAGYCRCPKDSKYNVELQYLSAVSKQNSTVVSHLSYTIYEVLSLVQDIYASKQILATYDKITPANVQEIQPRHMGLVAKARDSLVISIHNQPIMLFSTPSSVNAICYIRTQGTVRKTNTAPMVVEVNKGTALNRSRCFMVFPDEPKHIYITDFSDYSDLCRGVSGVTRGGIRGTFENNDEHVVYIVPRQLLWQDSRFSEIALAYYTVVSCYVQMAITRYVVKPRGVENSKIPTGEEHSKHLVSLIKTVYITNPEEVRFTYTLDKGIVGDSPRQRNAPKGGTHASPGAHNRRAHQRRLASGKIIWVKACRINPDKPPCKYRAATRLPVDFDNKE